MTSQEHWIGRVLSAGLTALLALTLTGFTAVVPATASVETPGAESDTVAAEVETELLSEPAEPPVEPPTEEPTEEPTEPVLDPLVTGTRPTVSGTAQVGKKLTAKPGTWTTGAVLTYQWYADGKAISGATATSYTLKAAQKGKPITVKVTGKKTGYTTASQTSSKTEKVAAGVLTTVKPTVSGTKKVGAKLTAKPGTWTKGAALSYQWYADGKAISGATKSSYTLMAAQKGKPITVKVTGKLAGYATASQTSAKTAKVAAGTLTTVKPAIAGTKKVGEKLTAKPGKWTTGTTFTYQWYRGDKKIKGATSSKYSLVIADLGKRISVKVTGKKSGYTTASKTSAKTAKVGRRALDTTSASSIHVLVNKKNKLSPVRYAPKTVTLSSRGVGGYGQSMRPVAADAMATMVKAAKKDGITLQVRSGYRSYATQDSLFNRYVRQSGRAAAETYSARPGYSEHQTGLAADVYSPGYGCELGRCFGDSKAGKWVAKNSWKYGYIVRYPSGKTSITGYIYEPWHVRYVGKDVAKDMHDGGYSTYEEYLGKKAAPNY